MVAGDLATAVDVLVLGAGPGGYVAAIRAAQLGREVVIVDPGPLGGTCLHEGCIPSKALLRAADQVWQLSTLAEKGINLSEVKIDLRKMQGWKDGIVRKLTQGIKHLLNHPQIEYISGKGWFINDHEVRVEGGHGSQRFIFEHCIIAVGAGPVALPNLLFDKERILTPSQALRLKNLPDKLALIGADYIAVEIATIFAKLGGLVDLLIPHKQHLLPEFDPSAGRQVQTSLKKLGVNISRMVDEPAKLLETMSHIVVSAGVSPHTDDLNLAQAQVQTDEQGFILVNDCLQTHNPTIYAVGDVTGQPFLANVAMKQGKVAVEHLAGYPTQYVPQATPQAAWTDPEVASVGLTANQAQDLGYQVSSGHFPMAANGQALTLSRPQGFVQTVSEQETEVLLGVTIVGPGATTLIGEAALALEMGATLTDLAETLHPHPALGETLQEAAEAMLGIAIHVAKQRRSGAK